MIIPLESKFGHLTVKGYKSANIRYVVACDCECGTKGKLIRAVLLSRGQSTCGHACRLTKKTNFKHGHAGGKGKKRTSEYISWCDMHQRCVKPSHENFKHYGGKGIGICRRWRSFVNFLSDMGPKPTLQHTIERFKNSRGYSPGNCKWGTKTEQTRNRRNTVRVRYLGKLVPLIQVAESRGMPIHALRRRIESGLTLAQSLALPYKKRKSPTRRES